MCSYVAYTAVYEWNLHSLIWNWQPIYWVLKAELLFQSDGSMWWRSRLRSTILANILASSGAVAAAAAARRTRAAPAFCMRLAWCTACRPPGIVNCS
jgi:hypothetical protein